MILISNEICKYEVNNKKFSLWLHGVWTLQRKKIHNPLGYSFFLYSRNLHTHEVTKKACTCYCFNETIKVFSVISYEASRVCSLKGYEPKKSILYYSLWNNLKKNFKQDAHAPHRLLEKHFQSINTFAQIYDYTLCWLREKKNDYILKLMIVPRLIDIDPMVLEKVFKFIHVFLLSYYHFPWENRHGPSFEKKLDFTSSECFVPSLCEYGPLVQKRKIFKFH